MRLNLNDVMIIFSIGMFLTVHIATQITFDKVAAPISERVEQVISVVEASPIARVTLQLGQYGFVLQFLLVPALVGGLYYAMRRRKFADPKDKEYALSGFAGVMFLAALINVVNDLSVLVGVL